MTGEEIDARRELCRPLLEYSCDGSAVDEFHAHYVQVTEGRDVGAMRAKYSSCADLAHWQFFRVGVRSPFVNRKEHRGWVPGVNVSRLASLPGSASVGNIDGFRPELGDVLIVWNRADTHDAHVICVLDFDFELNLLTTAEYGQPGGAIKTTRVGEPPMLVRVKKNPDGTIATDARGSKIYESYPDPDRRPFVGRKRVQRWIRFADVLLRAALAGELAEPSLPWEKRTA